MVVEVVVGEVSVNENHHRKVYRCGPGFTHNRHLPHFKQITTRWTTKPMSRSVRYSPSGRNLSYPRRVINKSKACAWQIWRDSNVNINSVSYIPSSGPTYPSTSSASQPPTPVTSSLRITAADPANHTKKTIMLTSVKTSRSPHHKFPIYCLIFNELPKS